MSDELLRNGRGEIITIFHESCLCCYYYDLYDSWCYLKQREQDPSRYCTKWRERP